MTIKCIKKQNGITIDKTYELLGCAGEYVQIKDDTNKEYVYQESYFENVN